MSLRGNSITSDIPVFLDETVKSSIKMSRRDRILVETRHAYLKKSLYRTYGTSYRWDSMVSTDIVSLRDIIINAMEAFIVYMDKTEIEIYRIYRFELILISCLSRAIP
jgi:hypothetical protein